MAVWLVPWIGVISSSCVICNRMKNNEIKIYSAVVEVADARRLAQNLKLTLVLARILQIEVESSAAPGGERANDFPLGDGAI